MTEEPGSGDPFYSVRAADILARLPVGPPHTTARVCSIAVGAAFMVNHTPQPGYESCRNEL